MNRRGFFVFLGQVAAAIMVAPAALEVLAGKVATLSVVTKSEEIIKPISADDLTIKLSLDATDFCRQVNNIQEQIEALKPRHIYVSSFKDGDDRNDGTERSPVRTIAKAMELARDNDTINCRGLFREDVQV